VHVCSHLNMESTAPPVDFSASGWEPSSLLSGSITGHCFSQFRSLLPVELAALLRRDIEIGSYRDRSYALQKNDQTISYLKENILFVSNSKCAYFLKIIT